MRGGNTMPEEDGEQFRKLFVGGLHFETTEKTLKEYFEKFGQIVDCVVMKDSNSQRSRGFGFVTFQTAEMLDEAQKGRPHRIDNKDVETKRAMPREDAGRPDIHLVSKKVYVSGVRDGIEEEDLREYFSRYGDIDSVEIITDKSTGQRRGFAFISFNDYDPVDKIVLIKSHQIKDRRCDVKKAMSREEMAQLKFGYNSDLSYKRPAAGLRAGGSRGRGGFDRRDYHSAGRPQFYDSQMGYGYPGSWAAAAGDYGYMGSYSAGTAAAAYPPRRSAPDNSWDYNNSKWRSWQQQQQLYDPAAERVYSSAGYGGYRSSQQQQQQQRRGGRGSYIRH